MKKSDLYKMRSAILEKEQLEDTIAKLENMRYSPRSPAYGTDKVQTSAKGDIQPDNIDRVDKTIALYNKKLAYILDSIAAFELLLEPLNEFERKVMRSYFIHVMTWEEICVAEKKSWSRIMQIRRDCLAIICEDVEPEGLAEVKKIASEAATQC